MGSGRWIVAPFLTAGILAAAPVVTFAQSLTETRVGVNPYVGVFIFDDGELQTVGREANVVPMFGARLNVGVSRRWELDAAYGYAQVETEPSEFEDFPDPEEQIELDVHAIYGAANYFLGGTQDIPTRLVLGAGLGLLIVNPESGEGDADFMIPISVGFTHPVNDWITFLGEVRDHVHFCSTSEDASEAAVCFGDEVLNHFEVSGGLKFWVWPRMP